VNDVILLFTDGLYEVDNPAQEEYGQERLLTAVRQRYQLPTERLLDELLQDVHRFSTAKEFEDDVCLVAMEIAKLGA
jgi:sigma-B regulation protein RsbU (phosphoserine phosphatase)